MLNKPLNLTTPVKCYLVTLDKFCFNIMVQDLIIVYTAGYATQWLGKHFFDAYLHYVKECGGSITFTVQCSATYFYGVNNG